MIVPDYWFGNFTYKFQSLKKSLADAFVGRKLQAQFPHLPDVNFFFDSISYPREHRERWLYAYFLQDPQFYKLNDALAELDLVPRRITSPALIWESKIRQIMPDFDNGGKCFIELLPSIYHLYFFFEGNFLFSRSIPLADSAIDTPENLQAIAYELNQSLYLFSQRAKEEVNKLYLLLSQKLPVGVLSDALGREINDLSSAFNAPRSPQHGDASVYPTCGFGRPLHILLRTQFLSLSHRKLKSAMEWKPVQSVGTAIALLLCLLLGAESFFLYRWSDQYKMPAAKGDGAFTGQTKQKILQYNDALDILIDDAARHSPRQIIAAIAKSLPQEIGMQQLFLKAEADAAVEFKGIFNASGPGSLKSSLTNMIADLNQNLHPRNGLAIPDIDIEFDKNKQSYLIKFRVEL